MAEVNENPSRDINQQIPPKKSSERERVRNIFLNQYRGDAVVVPIKLVSTEINIRYSPLSRPKSHKIKIEAGS
jgi:hypothetical protein